MYVIRRNMFVTTASVVGLLSRQSTRNGFRKFLRYTMSTRFIGILYVRNWWLKITG